MSGFINRVVAISVKEVKDIKTNANVVLMFFIPLLFAYLFSNFVPGMTPSIATTFSLFTAIAMGGVYVPAMLIAEEKEKNTLRVLMLSPVTALEVMIGKSVVTFIAVSLTAVAAGFITGAGLGNAAVFVFTVGLSLIFTISLGLIIGLLSPNMMATGVVGLPVYLILMLVPLLRSAQSEVVNKLVAFIPTYHTGEALFKNYEGAGLNHIISHWLYILVAMVIALTLLLIIYKKKGLEN